MSFGHLTIEYEKELLQKESIPGVVKTAIIDFVDGDLVLENLSEERRKNYIQRLRVLARWIPDEFLDPSTKALKAVIIHLNGDDYTESTKSTYLKMYKKFCRVTLPRGKFESAWEKIKIPNPKTKVTRADLISFEEVQKLIENAKNGRDRALFALLYDSGCRIGEVLNMRVNNLSFDEYGAVLEVPKGKTGQRLVRIVGDSIPYLRSWLNDHPLANKPDAPLFCGISDGIRGRALTYDDIYAIIRKAVKRAGMTKRIHPHLFRHSRASILAGKLPEAILESQMGWVHGTKQSATYVHLSGRQQDRAVLQALGIEVKDKEDVPKPKPCHRCGELNPSNAIRCKHCWLPLDEAEAIKESRRLKMVESAMQVMDISSRDKERLQSFGDSAKIELIADLLLDLEKSGQLDNLRKILAISNQKEGE
ncbi:MAG: tyrosine-type recombinase/integrase [Candidatus Thermoplasmatota archaeon]|jgi:integrase|nr:tyrosine-type recombinase/integrase [Candidatus Thermoplasmatota archaeon]MCL5785357.1 tyrosine-type recombinase/integrase [Candidatus Thermoplasmatota archaeon]